MNMQIALPLDETSNSETVNGIAVPVERLVMPEWWDDDLHGVGLAALSEEWQTLGELKPLLGEYSDMTFEIMRDLAELGLAAQEVRITRRSNGSVKSGKAFYRKA
jgi:hypothetical protein